MELHFNRTVFFLNGFKRIYLVHVHFHHVAFGCILVNEFHLHHNGTGEWEVWRISSHWSIGELKLGAKFHPCNFVEILTRTFVFVDSVILNHFLCFDHVTLDNGKVRSTNNNNKNKFKGNVVAWIFNYFILNENRKNKNGDKKLLKLLTSISFCFIKFSVLLWVL